MPTIHLNPETLQTLKECIEERVKGYEMGSIRWEPVEEWHGEIGCVEYNKARLYFAIAGYKDTIKLTVSTVVEENPHSCYSESKRISKDSMEEDTAEVLERVLVGGAAKSPCASS